MDFPYVFLGYCILLALLVLYYLYLASRVRATFFEKVLTYALNKFLPGAEQGDQELKIGLFLVSPVLPSPSLLECCRVALAGSIGFALLAGRIILHRVEYRTRNMVLKILKCTINLNWYFRVVRTPDTRHKCKSRWSFLFLFSAFLCCCCSSAGCFCRSFASFVCPLLVLLFTNQTICLFVWVLRLKGWSW
jgi:hypothetical protein